MSAATLTRKGQIIIPAEIRARHGLTAGTQLEFIDDGGDIRLVVRRRIAASNPEAGFGLIRVKRSVGAKNRRLSDFDAADLLKEPRRAR